MQILRARDAKVMARENESNVENQLGLLICDLIEN